MKKNNSVIFKGRKDGIVILLDGVIAFTEIKDALSGKMADAKGFFKDGKTAITFKGRELTENEEQELLDIISQQTDMSITFAQSAGLGIRGDSLPMASEEAKPTDDDTAGLIRTIESFAENSTLFKIESLRSGQSIHYAGSVVIVGDVNPGAEIVAEGNVVVLGKLSGMAHAGCTGVEDCIVAAIRLAPIQLRIGDIITIFPKDFAETDMNSKRPLYAFVKDEQIHVRPLI